MDISPDKDTLSCLTCRRRIERAVWVIWIELGQSGEFCDIRIPCIIYTRKSGLPVRDRIFGNFRKSKYRSKFLIRFLEIAHQRVSLEKLWAIRKNWSCPEILDFYRKSLLKRLVSLTSIKMEDFVLITSEVVRPSESTFGFSAGVVIPEWRSVGVAHICEGVRV